MSKAHGRLGIRQRRGDISWSLRISQPFIKYVARLHPGLGNWQTSLTTWVSSIITPSPYPSDPSVFLAKASPSCFRFFPSTWFSHPLPSTSSRTAVELRHSMIGRRLSNSKHRCTIKNTHQSQQKILACEPVLDTAHVDGQAPLELPSKRGGH